MKRLHTTRERPSCELCHRVFFDATTLRNHINTVHHKTERPPRRRLPCPFIDCKSTFTGKGSITCHVKREHAQNPVRFRCTLCGKDTKTMADLGFHINTHTTEKPHKCATCGQGFARKGHLKSHKVNIL